jgi:hypothetical protein
MKFLFLFLHVQSIKCCTVAFMTLAQNFVKIHSVCPCIWAVNRNGHSIKSYFMHIMQEMYIVFALKIQFSHSVTLTVGKQHCRVCIVKKLAECAL